MGYAGATLHYPSILGKIRTARKRASPSGKASAFQADIRGFESRRPLWARSSVAERTAHNRLVAGSNPAGPIRWHLLDAPSSFCLPMEWGLASIVLQ